MYLVIRMAIFLKLDISRKRCLYKSNLKYSCILNCVSKAIAELFSSAFTRKILDFLFLMASWHIILNNNFWEISWNCLVASWYKLVLVRFLCVLLNRYQHCYCLSQGFFQKFSRNISLMKSLWTKYTKHLLAEPIQLIWVQKWHCYKFFL